MTLIADIAIDWGGNEFLRPYVERSLGVKDDDAPRQPRAGIRIVTDDAGCDPDSALDRLCTDKQLPLVTLRCPYIVGTGMLGLPRRIAQGIYRGTYVHIWGNEARISVIHATDVAKAISLAAGIQGSYTLNDGVDPTIHDLAEALAYRMADKRIITIKPRWARLWYGGSYYNTLTTDHTAQQTFSEVFPVFSPVSVTEYLRTHVYDDQSL